MEAIEILGGRIHNLKNIDVRIPKGKIVAITGVSGSGKSSLAFDLLFEEGRVRYLQAIGMPPRLESEKPFDAITGLSPTIAVEQRTVRYKNPRSTVGTRTGVYNYLRMLYTLEAERLCPLCKEPVGQPIGKNLTCNVCGMKLEHLEVKHFSFNEPSGMCLKCSGRGYIRVFLPEKIVPDTGKNLFEICATATATFADLRNWMPNLARHYDFDLKAPYRDLPKRIIEIFLYGSGGKKLEVLFKSRQYEHVTQKVYEGVIPHLERALEKSISPYRQRKIEKDYMDKVLCPECRGYRVNKEARQALIEGKNIGELASLPVDELSSVMKQLDKRPARSPNGKALVSKIIKELGKFELIGLSYLHLNRVTVSLSGGENQRLSLLSQMSLGLNGCILILDEPTMGMHDLEKESLSRILIELRDAGNTVLIVEHDPRLINKADEVIDLGPFSGFQGGEIIFQGPVSNLLEDRDSLTGRYLSAREIYPTKKAVERRTPNPERMIRLKDISTNNLKNVTVDIPLGSMVGVCGVSGSGKSSLISDTLVPLLQERLSGGRKAEPESFLSEDEEGVLDPLEVIRGSLENWDLVNDCTVVDQAPIGRSRNSFPASYIGLWDLIRKLFARQPLSKERSYTEGHFSFNSDRGRCPVCRGEGRIALSISFLDEITLPCEECGGSRYLPEILEIRYAGRNIRRILDLSVEETLQLFEREEKIFRYLKILDDIGMGYMKLGQPATTLSGGEAQRVKLAKALGNADGGSTLYVLDEPSTGLHFHDEAKLLVLLSRLVVQGNSVIIIEHNTNILSYCDWIIELGPRGGPEGGYLIAQGTPEKLKKNKKSLTGTFLQ